MSALSSGAGVGAGTSPSVVISRQPLRAQSQAGEQCLAFCFAAAALLFWPYSDWHSRDGCAVEAHREQDASPQKGYLGCYSC